MVVIVAAIFFISGLRDVPETLNAQSGDICGPLKDQNGNPAGDAGPCPSLTPLPTPREARWEWAPFWVAAD